MQETQDAHEFQAFLFACTQEGCPLCRLVEDRVQRYLDGWAYEFFTDVEIREELRHSQGFCHQHTWQLARLGAALPLAQTYRVVLSDLIDQLQPNIDERSHPSSTGWFNRLFASREQHAPCPACRLRDQAITPAVYTLRKALLNPIGYEHVAASRGLCLPHFRLACTSKPRKHEEQWLPLLRKAQLGCLQRLDEELAELIRKHDYRFKDEEHGDEMVSWKRAAGLVAGEEFPL